MSARVFDGLAEPSEWSLSERSGSSPVLQTECDPDKIRPCQDRGDAMFGREVGLARCPPSPLAAKRSYFRGFTMTKKIWTSLVLGLTLSSPALMVGCGEEAPKADAPKVDAAAPAAPGAPGEKPATPAPAPAK